MTEFITVPIETDPDTIAQDAFDVLQSANPGWEPSDGQLDTWILQAVAGAAATVNDTASAVPASIFRYFGAKVIGLTPVDAVEATASTTWTLTDTLGHTIPAGSVIGVPDGYGNYLPFETLADVVVAPGVSTVSAVTVQALDAGSAGSGLGTVGTQCTLLDQLAFVTSVVLAGTTAGGTDAEDDVLYLNRLAAYMTLVTPEPILPGDFSALALTIDGVGRAANYDGYDAVALTTGNARTITVAVVTASGALVSTGVKSQVQAYLSSLREVNFLVYVVDPTLSTVDVNYTAVVYPGYDPVEVKGRINSALGTFLSPASWGMRNDGNPQIWDNKTVVKLNDIIVAIGRVDGVDDVNAVTMRVSPAAFAAADITLAGVFPMPQAGVLTGTVS